MDSPTPDQTPEFARGMVEGEARFRIQCNFCGAIDEVHIMVPPHLRDKMAEIIKKDPDSMLDTAAEMASMVNGWSRAELRDGGGVVDICPECIEKGDWMKL